MLSGSYEFLAQDRVVFGRPAAEAVVETAERLGKRRLLLVSSKTLNRETDVTPNIREALGDRCIGVFDDCIEHVPRAAVLALATRVRALSPDLIVTVGGGTPVDTVKVMLAALACDVTDESGLESIRIKVDASGKRVVPAIPQISLRQIIR
jgi:alcohol dehydrogenase class IV